MPSWRQSFFGKSPTQGFYIGGSAKVNNGWECDIYNRRNYIVRGLVKSEEEYGLPHCVTSTASMDIGMDLWKTFDLSIVSKLRE